MRRKDLFSNSLLEKRIEMGKEDLEKVDEMEESNSFRATFVHCAEES